MGVRNWDTGGRGERSCVFVPFRGARSKGVDSDGTSWEGAFTGWIGREEGWKE